MSALNRIAEIREEKGLSLRDLEKLSGVDHSTISLVENGLRSPTQHTILLISKALECDTGDVFYLNWRKLNI